MCAGRRSYAVITKDRDQIREGQVHIVIAWGVASGALGDGLAHAHRTEPLTSTTVTVEQLRAYAAEGHFASGSMGPKVDAACRFVEHGGTRAVITDLANLTAAISGDAGTVVVPT